MNLSAILADCYRRTAASSSPPADVTTRLTAFVNTTHRQILGIPGLDILRDDTITFASVAAQSLYGLPPVIARIEAITDRTTSLRLNLGTLDDLRASDPGLVQTGTSDAYVPRGMQQVAVQPTAATGLWIVSTSAADTTQSLKLETVRTGGYLYSAAATANGLTRVQVGTLTDHIEVVKFYTSAVGVGDLKLYDAAVAGNLLATIPIGSTYARVLQIQLYPTPSAAITYYVDYVRTIPDLVNATDEPLVPEDFQYLLIEGALMKEWAKRDDDRRSGAERAYREGLAALKYFVTCPPDFLPSRQGGLSTLSRFGAFFPATRY